MNTAQARLADIILGWTKWRAPAEGVLGTRQARVDFLLDVGAVSVIEWIVVIIIAGLATMMVVGPAARAAA